MIKLGTRGSRLALAQASIVQTHLHRYNSNLDIQIVPIATTGDLNTQDSLSEIGGKGVFIKEIQHALLNGDIDIAVHSMKDITSSPPDALHLSGFLKAESICDTLISKHQYTLDTLPKTATIATGSMRRRALLKRTHPHCQFVDIRGNIDTRIQKLHANHWDALILSEAGLIRLGLNTQPHHPLHPSTFYPAPGQGVIALETRKADSLSTQFAAAISDPDQTLISSLEYDLLKHLQFNCQIPLGVYTQLINDHIEMTLFVENTDQKWKEWTLCAHKTSATHELHSLIKDIRHFLNDSQCQKK
jgi:hydroxymethylbilane synthase